MVEKRTTNVINNRTMKEIHVSGMACSTSPSNTCAGENKILTPFEIVIYPTKTMMSPILVDGWTYSGCAIESRMLNMTGTIPYPNATTPNQLLASVQFFGNRFNSSM
mmetsp:Transcript_2091/g.4501  ORF Transcript_2091/g.4501 Transcript_2091/m.4501 type:complete len:107 (-) Transcript_2091:848-1168(-)